MANEQLLDENGTVVPNHYLVDGILHVTSEGQTIEELLVAPEVPPIPAYILSRRNEYPPTEDFMEAYTEKEIGGDSTKWDAYIIAYNKVRTDNPKG